MTIFLPVLAGALLSFLLCGLVRRLPLLDAPDGERKRQAVPVPRTGGLGILLATAIVAAAGAAIPGSAGTDGISALTFAGAATLVIAPFLIGFLDDWLGLPALTKLALLAVWALAAALPFLLEGTPAGLLMGVFAFGWLIVISNATNFMDGSNGLALGSAGLMALGLFALYLILALCRADDMPAPLGPAAMRLQLAFAGAVAGFLVWNMRGVLYAGDCGSLGAGGLIGLMVLYRLGASWQGFSVILFGLTVSLPFLLDVLPTLAWRSLKGRNLLKAHTDHAYQRLRARGWGHVRTAATWWSFTAVCVAAAAWSLLADAQAAGCQPVYPARQGLVFGVLAAIGTALWLAERSRPLSRPG